MNPATQVTAILHAMHKATLGRRDTSGNALRQHPNAHTMQLDVLILLLFEIYAIRKYQLFLINFGFLGFQSFIRTGGSIYFVCAVACHFCA